MLDIKLLLLRWLLRSTVITPKGCLFNAAGRDIVELKPLLLHLSGKHPNFEGMQSGLVITFLTDSM